MMSEIAEQSSNAYRVLLIDDRRAQLDVLAAAVRAEVAGRNVTVDAWRPGDDESDDSGDETTDPLDLLESRVDAQTVLVATDWDLTSSMRGLFGSAIVRWCQARLVPVADFSRGTRREALSEPGLFDIRLGTSADHAAAEIRTLVDGFTTISSTLAVWLPTDEANATPASALSHILGVDDTDSAFAPYLTRVGAANGALLNRLRELASEDPSNADKVSVLTYMLGHVLRNGILQYPGPILGVDSLCAYCATGIGDRTKVIEALGSAEYTGPFSEPGAYFWRSRVDKILDEAVAGSDLSEIATFDAYNRFALSILLGREPARHGCDRCGGTRGGYWCPFTHRPVCDRVDCSVGSSSWIPYGADLTRMERDFYDEWAPLMGY